MNEAKFEWDSEKNAANIKKHGISFEEAKAVFDDPLAVLFDDPDHSLGEERFLIIGAAAKGVCIVSHCYREENNVIRIISARKATKSEQKFYEEGE